MNCHLALLCSFLLALASATAAEEQKVIQLWPQGSPGQEPTLGPEADTTKDSDGKIAGQRLIRLGNVSTPTITVYPAPKEKATGAAVLVCPGGGYHILAMDLEGTEVCERLNAMGVTSILLKYRVPKRPNTEKHAPMLQDAQRAMGLIRQHADEWGIDKKRVGVLGFSAGGHLAAVLSSQYQQRTYSGIDSADDLSCRPDFTVLIYPGYLAAEPDRTKLPPEITITPESPQAFIAMAQDDPVHVENALVYAAELQKQKIPFELHHRFPRFLFLDSFDLAEQLETPGKILQLLAFGGVDDADAIQSDIQPLRRLFDLTPITQKNWHTAAQRVELPGRLQYAWLGPLRKNDALGMALKLFDYTPDKSHPKSLTDPPRNAQMPIDTRAIPAFRIEACGRLHGYPPQTYFEDMR